MEGLSARAEIAVRCCRSHAPATCDRVINSKKRSAPHHRRMGSSSSRWNFRYRQVVGRRSGGTIRAPVEADKSSRSAVPEIYQQPDFPPAVPANRLGLHPLTTPATVNFYLFEGMGKNSLIGLSVRFSSNTRDTPYCHQHSRVAAEPECLLITGQTGAGKTTICQNYSGRFPRQPTKTGICAPVLSASIPVPATVKSLVTRLLLALGDPMPERGSVVSQTLRLFGLVRECQVDLVILDLC
jgi:Bacterial TniB protein